MMIQGVSISEMLNQSMTVITKPSVTSFEQFERHGGQREALTYVGIAAAISAVAALLGGLLINSIVVSLISAIVGLIMTFAMFFIFAFVLFSMGKQQGGTGTRDEVFYTCALYTAPLLAINGVIGNIPFLNCIALPGLFLLWLYQVYLGYLAARSSMNLEQTPAILSVVVAIIAQGITFAVFGLILGLIVVAMTSGPATIPGG